MKIVCCANMPYAHEAFSTLCDPVLLDGRKISRQDVRDADVLAIRSTTPVNAGLLAGSSVRFVGTATIGTDHMDVGYLERAGIRWSSAAGCNANSVSEYVAAALLRLSVRHGLALEGATLGVVGLGNVGSLVADKARALGMSVLACDPPRERAEGSPAPLIVPQEPGFGPPLVPAGVFRGGGVPLVSLHRLLEEADVVTLHTPLTDEGPDATRHMADGKFFIRIRKGATFLNCARGAIVETDALLAACGCGRVAHAVIDTWEGEPEYRPDLLRKAAIGTPHIAGHSLEGRVAGTVMVYRAVCRFLGVTPRWSPVGLLPAPAVPRVEVNAAGHPEARALDVLVRSVYDIEADDRRLRGGDNLDGPARAGHFDRLRREYPVRREFRFTSVAVRSGPESLGERVRALGFELC
jgi:erythronate-4-phosphate dehydrogenase